MLHPGAEVLPFDNDWEDFIHQYMDFRDEQPLKAGDFFPF